MDDLTKRFTAHEMSNDQQERAATIRSAGNYLAVVIQKNTLVGREQSLALTNIEQAVFWANAGVAREGV